jgi:hypothetical protein
MGVLHALSEPAFKPREVIAGKDARTLAEEVLAMSHDQFGIALMSGRWHR